MKKKKLKQQKDISFYTKQINYLEAFISNEDNEQIVIEMDLNNQLQKVKNVFNVVSSNHYFDSLIGTIGADPLYRK